MVRFILPGRQAWVGQLTLSLGMAGKPACTLRAARGLKGRQLEVANAG